MSRSGGGGWDNIQDILIYTILSLCSLHKSPLGGGGGVEEPALTFFFN